MKFKLKKLIALGLTLAMTCSALSMPAYALNVVDNPEVSTDGTNSVDSSTFETVDITTDENGNTVIGTDETESETTTPTEGGETTTPPTTEGKEETVTPPTTGGEGETITPPEVIDPGFGVDPVDPGFNVDPEVPPTEGGETEVPEVPEVPETPEFIPEEVVGLDELIAVMSVMPMADETVRVDFVDANGETIKTENVQMGYIDDIIGEYQTLEYNGHYKLVEPKVIGPDGSEDDVEFIGKYVDPVTKEEYIYYSTDGISAILISRGGTSYGYRLVFEYQEYFKINYSFESSLGTLNGPTEINAGEDLVVTAKPTRGNATRSITAGAYSVPDVKLDYGEYTIPAINITSDITVTAVFNERTEPYVLTINNSDKIGLEENYTREINKGERWKTFSKEWGDTFIPWLSCDFFGPKKDGEYIKGVYINGEFHEVNINYGAGGFGSNDEVITDIQTIDGETKITIRSKKEIWAGGFARYFYRIEASPIYNDIELSFVTASANWGWIYNYLIPQKVTNTTLYEYNEGAFTERQPGQKIDAREENQTHYFYFKPNVGYEVTSDSLKKISGENRLELSDISTVDEMISSGIQGATEAKAAGYTYGFTAKTSDNASFSLECSAINYKVNYTGISGVTDGNTYNIGQQIKLQSPSTEPDGEGKIFAGWKINGIDTIYPGGSSFALNETTCLLADTSNTFVFTAQFVDAKDIYTIEYYFENADGTDYSKLLTFKGTVSQTSGASKIAIAMPLKASDMPKGYEDYEYDPTIPGSKITADLNVEQGATLKVYYRAPRRLIYSYQENGVTKNVTDGVRYSKGEEATLWTAPVSTKAGSEDLYFAGWEHNGIIYKAGETYTFPDKAEKAIFTAVYYSTEVANGGEVDTTLFGNLKVDYNADKTSACVYGTTSIPEGNLGDYKEIGFVISSYNNAPTTVGGFKATVDDTVYGKIKVNGKYNTPNADGHYYFGVNFNLCNNKAVKEFTATPYVTLNDGTIIYGAPVDINFNK